MVAEDGECISGMPDVVEIDEVVCSADDQVPARVRQSDTRTVRRELRVGRACELNAADVRADLDRADRLVRVQLPQTHAAWMGQKGSVSLCC